MMLFCHQHPALQHDGGSEHHHHGIMAATAFCSDPLVERTENRRSDKINFNFFPTSASSTFDGFGFTSACRVSQALVKFDKRLSTFTSACQIISFGTFVHNPTCEKSKSIFRFSTFFTSFFYPTPTSCNQPPALAGRRIWCIRVPADAKNRQQLKQPSSTTIRWCRRW